MAIRIGINGFGRIGRGVFNAGFESDDIEFVGINDITDPATLAHLLKYDSVHGKAEYQVDFTENSLIVGTKEIPISKELDPANIPWDDWNVDYVFECTGIFRTYELASKHLERGVKRVIISAPDKGKVKPIPPFVLGVNEKNYDSQRLAYWKS